MYDFYYSDSLSGTLHNHIAINMVISPKVEIQFIEDNKIWSSAYLEQNNLSLFKVTKVNFKKVSN
jgi:hypothetical protein